MRRRVKLRQVLVRCCLGDEQVRLKIDQFDARGLVGILSGELAGIGLSTKARPGGALVEVAESLAVQLVV